MHLLSQGAYVSQLLCHSHQFRAIHPGLHQESEITAFLLTPAARRLLAELADLTGRHGPLTILQGTDCCIER